MNFFALPKMSTILGNHPQPIGLLRDRLLQSRLSLPPRLFLRTVLACAYSQPPQAYTPPIFMLCVTPSDVFQTKIIESIFYQHFCPLQPQQKTPIIELEEDAIDHCFARLPHNCTCEHIYYLPEIAFDLARRAPGIRALPPLSPPLYIIVTMAKFGVWRH